MSNVVHLKFKGPAPTDEARAAIEAEFLRLADKYGCYEVMTVATSLLAVAMETALAKHRPNTDGWVADLQARLEQALKATPHQITPSDRSRARYG